MYDQTADKEGHGVKGRYMEAYQNFARVYDLFMEDVDYDGWSAYLAGLLEEYGVADGLVLDLACGTGNITERLAAMGYDMIGADCSPDMLEAAMEKRAASGHDILYLQQDMRSFELYGTVRAVICAFDSLNYILDEKEIAEVFRLVCNYLDPGGVFIFDVNTCYKYEQLGDTTIAENREEASFIWENCYDRERRINEYGLTLFVRGEDGRYEKYEELHEQRAYPLPVLLRLLAENGLEPAAVYDAFTREPAREESERVCVVARE